MKVSFNLPRVLLVATWTLLFIPELTSAAPKSKAGLSKPHTPVVEPSTKLLTLAEIEVLQKKLHSNKSLSVDFTQTIYRSLRKKSSVRTGKGYFYKPNSFRWSLIKPTSEDWIYNGKFLANYLPAKKTVFKYQSSAAKGKDLQHLIDMVLNFSSLFTQYQLVDAQQTGDDVRMNLKPKVDGEIETTAIILDLGKNYVREIKLNFRGGNYTLFTFINPSTKPLDEQLFALPKGVKIEEVI